MHPRGALVPNALYTAAAAAAAAAGAGAVNPSEQALSAPKGSSLTTVVAARAVRAVRAELSRRGRCWPP